MTVVRPRVVSLIGGSACTPSQAQDAEAVGRLLAERGIILVCGGRTGVMEAACRGAVEVGGTTIGILPGDSPSEGNPYLTVALPTGLGHARNMLVVLAGEAVIAIGGGPGTLSEIGFALKVKRRVIALDSWTASDFAGDQAPILTAQSPEDAVEFALAKEV
ncbi:MAG TPA: TIGR00725 family protein [Anaerolineae bacterium]|nr:TIGR00725 family protein [Anaerolineae bacterium]